MPRVDALRVDRGAYRFAQADVVLGRLREEPRGLAFLELALDEDPQNDRALSALIAVRTRREEWAELAAVYERLIDRFAGLGDRERAWEVCRKLGVLRRDRLLDGPGAIEAMRGAVEVRPDDVEIARGARRALRGEGRSHRRGERARDRRGCTRRCARRRIAGSTICTRARSVPIARGSSATCLEELGAADVSHELVIEQFRPDGPIRPTTALEEGWWDECLGAARRRPDRRATSSSPSPTRRSGSASKSSPRRRSCPSLDPATKQDKASTASVVRTFVWAARALGIALPDLYLARRRAERHRGGPGAGAGHRARPAGAHAE